MSPESPERDRRPVFVERFGPVCTIVLDRPKKLNALTEPLLLDLASALRDAADDGTVRAVVLVSSGRAFCAGQDLSTRDPRLHDQPFDLEAIQKRLFHPVLRAMREMSKPVIASVRGVAAGAGAGIALAADIVLAANDARFILSFARVGLSVDAGIGFSLVHALGPARARGLMMTGGTLSGREAAEAGLIFRSIPDDRLDEETASLAADIGEGPTVAYGAMKRAVEATASGDFTAYLEREAALQGEAGLTKDYREGVLAFLEKRPPRFRGE